MTRNKAIKLIKLQKQNLQGKDKHRLGWWIHETLIYLAVIFGKDSEQYDVLKQYETINITDKDYDVFVGKCLELCDISISNIKNGLMKEQPETRFEKRTAGVLLFFAGIVTANVKDIVKFLLRLFHIHI